MIRFLALLAASAAAGYCIAALTRYDWELLEETVPFVGAYAPDAIGVIPA